MRPILTCFAAMLGAGGILCQAGETRTPVVLELFTSEGCSSCPPADELLSKLDREQPIPGVELIVIGEHVDYFNHDGWKDPYSSALFTERQERYATWLHGDDPFTPQMIVNGAAQVVGSNWVKVKAAVEAARRSETLGVRISAVNAGNKREVTASVEPDSRVPAGDVYLVLAADSMQTQVKGGENSGRHLSHTAVAYSVRKIGKTSPESAFEKNISLPVESKWGGATRIIAFVQDENTGRILGAAQAKL